MSVRPIVTAASLRSAAARLPERRVRDESTLPPEILLLGARQRHQVKCFALGQAGRSSPHSAIDLSGSPGITVPSTYSRSSREIWAEAVNLRQVLAEQRKERRAVKTTQARRLPMHAPDAVTATDRPFDRDGS